MNRWLAILLLGTYLCSATELHQFIKMPALFGHYLEHAEENADETLLCFLADHYFSGEHHDAEEGHDHELPFQCHHDCTNHGQQIATSFPVGAAMMLAPVAEAEQPLTDDASYSFQLSRDVWQPPKTA